MDNKYMKKYSVRHLLLVFSMHMNEDGCVKKVFGALNKIIVYFVKEV